MIAAIKSLGVRVFELDFDALLSEDRGRLNEHIGQLRQFAPQFAVATPNAGYGVLARHPQSGANLFTDLLEIPLVLSWDSICQFAAQRFALAADPEKSVSGVDRTLRTELGHPLLYHVSFDSGQIAAMEALGIVPATRVMKLLAPIYQEAIDVGKSANPFACYDDDVVFAGNLFLKRATLCPLRDLDTVWNIVYEAVHNRALAVPIWDSLQARLSQMSVQDLESEKLRPSESFFWSVLNEAISHVANSHDRVSMLRNLNHKVAFYGGFCDADEHVFMTREVKCDYKGAVGIGEELAWVNARTRVTVDIINRISHHGVTAKPLNCIAAGGFSLFDFRADFARELGPLAENIMFRDFEEMNRKVDHYLTFESERKELAAELRKILIENYSVRDAYHRIFQGVAQCYNL